mmetsp:Transcript_67869/g.191305  ORF Transcript_67869/g.191305 Transcript_67869/m.191305 type:complete len:145 (+) Transcript_67869:73-507(+)
MVATIRLATLFLLLAGGGRALTQIKPKVKQPAPGINFTANITANATEEEVRKTTGFSDLRFGDPTGKTFINANGKPQPMDETVKDDVIPAWVDMRESGNGSTSGLSNVSRIGGASAADIMGSMKFEEPEGIISQASISLDDDED